MTTSTRIATGLAVTAVAGVLALGFALLLAPAESPADAAIASSEPTASAEEPDTRAVEPTDSEATESDGGLPDGYVNVGNGTWIPGGGPGDCEASAYIWIGSADGEPMRATMEGADLVDMGPREFANGTVEPDEQGRPLTYTVAAGDVVNVIGDRFCIYNGLSLTTLNNYPPSAQIQPGDVLILNADYATDFFYPYPTE